MPDVPLKIQKNQIHFYENQEVEPGVFKDVLQFGLKCTLGAYEDLPTYGIRIEVDPGTPITCTMVNQAIMTKVNEFLAQKAIDDQKVQEFNNCPGVTEDSKWLYVTISV